jgi:hypothetical protein
MRIKESASTLCHLHRLIRSRPGGSRLKGSAPFKESPYQYQVSDPFRLLKYERASYTRPRPYNSLVTYRMDSWPEEVIIRFALPSSRLHIKPYHPLSRSYPD